MKKIALALCLPLALGALSACGGEKKAQPPAGPAATNGMLLHDARLVLPAVKGRPAAGYFTLANQSGSAATLTGVSVAHTGKAEMHQTLDGIMEAVPRLDIGSGQSVAFGPGGKHAMVFDVSPELAAGGKTELTLTFADGRKLSAPMRVEAPGMMAPDTMNAMDHSKM